MPEKINKPKREFRFETGFSVVAYTETKGKTLNFFCPDGTKISMDLLPEQAKELVAVLLEEPGEE